MTQPAVKTTMPPNERDRSRTIGAILVEQGKLAPNEVAEIQRFAGENGMRFGDAARQLNLVTQRDIDLAVAQQFNYPILDRGGATGVDDALIAAYQPQSELAEPLRALRSQLILRWLNVNKEAQKILAIASPARGDGRSWLASNLAVVFAQIGYRTLLIDADLRHPKQHELFNLDNTQGLSTVLCGRAGKEVVQRVHPQLRLFVLTAGSVPPNPQELLGRPVFDLVIKTFAENYDIVLIDTPATSETADAQLIASLAGTAVMVTRLQHTKSSDLITAVQNFIDSGVKVIGSIVNEC